MPLASYTPTAETRAGPKGSEILETVGDPIHILAIPVDGNGYPLNEGRSNGVLRQVPPATLVLELIAGAGFPKCNSLIIGLSAPDNTTRYASLVVSERRDQQAARITIIGHLGGPVQDILERDLIIPEFCANSFQYTLPYPIELLDSLAEIGILTRKYMDTVLVCPECYSLSTFRPGCPQCGSSLATVDRLIHHFSCGYMGFTSEFETPTGLVCPKCRMHHLAIGADFEYTAGAYRCSECGWTASQLRLIGHCLRCDSRYPGREATTINLVCFHAQRFDPMAIHSLP